MVQSEGTGHATIKAGADCQVAMHRNVGQAFRPDTLVFGCTVVLLANSLLHTHLVIKHGMRGIKCGTFRGISDGAMHRVWIVVEIPISIAILVIVIIVDRAFDRLPIGIDDAIDDFALDAADPSLIQNELRLKIAWRLALVRQSSRELFATLLDYQDPLNIDPLGMRYERPRSSHIRKDGLPARMRCVGLVLL